MTFSGSILPLPGSAGRKCSAFQEENEWSLYTDVPHIPNILWKANLLNDTSSSIKTFTTNFSKSHDSREQNWRTTAVLMVTENPKALSSMTLGLRTDQTVDNVLAYFWSCSFTPFISSNTSWMLTGQPFPLNMSYCPLTGNSCLPPWHKINRYVYQVCHFNLYF